jgi:acetyl-CoA carboxylase biotin carboxyl carrier protein
MAHQVLAPITGTIWKITQSHGNAVGETDTVVIMESMKMEMPVEAGCDGKVLEIHVKEGQPVTEGQPLFTIED